MTDEELEHAIWETMVEMGWLFPVTVEQVEMAERQMEEEDCPPLPEALRVPPVWRLRERIAEWWPLDGGVRGKATWGPKVLVCCRLSLKRSKPFPKISFTGNPIPCGVKSFIRL